MLLSSVIITNAQTKTTESNIFIYEMGETYYNSANFEQQNKIETGWFTKYGKIAPKYMKLSKYTTTLKVTFTTRNSWAYTMEKLNIMWK
jgi:hypothetical protein